MTDQPDVNVKLDTYVKLYERQMTHYENTQGVEWKVTIAMWTLLAAAISWTAQYPGVLRGFLGPYRLAVFVFPVFHALWLFRVHDSEQFDKRLWVRYRTAARVMLSLDAFPDDETVSERRTWDEVGWIAMEAGTTLVLAFALNAFLT